MSKKSEQILEAVKIHLQDQRNAYAAQCRDNPNLSTNRAFKYNDEQNRILLGMIAGLENIVTSAEMKAYLWDGMTNWGKK